VTEAQASAFSELILLNQKQYPEVKSGFLV
jgi:S1-C subfamily serine protease